MAVIVTRVMTLVDGRRALVIAEWMSSNSISLSYMINDIVYLNKNSALDAFILWGNSRNSRDFKTNLFMKRKNIPIIFYDSLGAQIPESHHDFDFYMGTSDAI